MAGGRPPKERSFYNALSVALRQANGKDVDGQPVTKLRVIAERLVLAAEAGEPWAIKEVADRIDGKAVQAVEHSGHLDSSPSQATDAQLEAIALSQNPDQPTTH